MGRMHKGVLFLGVYALSRDGRVLLRQETTFPLGTHYDNAFL
jgi:hypothetical protein